MGAGRLQGSFGRHVAPNWALGAVQVGRPGGLPEFTRWARGFLRSEMLIDVRITGGVPGVSGEGSGELLWALVSVTRRGNEQSIKKR